jgi:transposase-like protein
MPSSLRKYDQETRDRAVRMYRERRRDVPGESAVVAQRRVGELLDVKPATLRGWVERAEVDSGTRAGTTTETAALRRENAELRRANEILKTASAFFAAAELDRRLR